MKIENNWKEVRKARNKPPSPKRLWVIAFIEGFATAVAILYLIGWLLK